MQTQGFQTVVHKPTGAVTTATVHQLFMQSMVLTLWEVILTVRNEGGDQTGCSSYKVCSGEGKASPNAFNGEEDEEGSRELHQGRDEEVDVDVSSCYPYPHDEALINHSNGEPEHMETRAFNSC